MNYLDQKVFVSEQWEKKTHIAHQRKEKNATANL